MVNMDGTRQILPAVAVGPVQQVESSDTIKGNAEAAGLELRCDALCQLSG